MVRCFVALMCLLVAALALAEEKDPVKEKLFAARVVYDKEMSAFRKGVGDWFDDREEAARKDGNKKAVDQVKADREAFDAGGWLPKSAPPAVIQKPAAARKTLEAAYAQAIKDYTKAGIDNSAKKAEDALREFRYSLSPVGRVVGDAPVRVICKHSGRGLAVEVGRKEDGSPIWQWDNLDNPNHYWVLIPVEEEFFVLRNENSKTFLTAAGKDAVVITKGDPDSAKQLHWKFIPVRGEPGCFLVRSRTTGRYLDVYLAPKDNGVVKHFGLNGSDGSANQHWKFEKVKKAEKK